MRVGMRFCASGRVALERNLSAAEMVEQVFWAEEAFGRKINSLVFMGMGEPLANFRIWSKRFKSFVPHWG
jgi:23S rRNA (adenine2503-C2)-methyltransferase